MKAAKKLEQLEKHSYLELILRFYFHFTFHSLSMCSKALLILLFPTVKCLTYFMIRHKYDNGFVKCDVHANNYHQNHINGIARMIYEP